MCTIISAGPRRAKARVRALIATLILLPILIVVIYRVTGDRMLQTRLDALAAQGEAVTLGELTQAYALPPGIDNAADLYLEAFDSVVKWMKEDPRREDLPLAGDAALPPRNEPLSAIAKERIGQYLDDNRAALDILHRAAAISHCRYPRDFSTGFDMDMDWLAQLRQCAFLLKLEAIHHLENGRTDSAVRSLRSGMALGQSIYPPVLIEQLVRISVMSLNINTLETILNRTPLTNAQLQTLSAELQAEDPKASLSIAIQGERCMGIAVFRGTTGAEGLGAAGGDPTPRLLGPLRAVGYLQRDAAGYLDLMQAFLDTLDLPTAEGMRQTDSLAVEEHGGMFTRILAPAMARIAQLAGRAETHQQIALTALALERHQIAHGTLPEDLNQLVPAALESIPIDPFDGKPLRYRLLNPGYVVYSIGEDRTDDGGKERVRREERGEKDEPWDVTFVVERE